MKNRLIIITSFIVLLFGQTVLKALDDTLWCKYTYPSSVHFVKFSPDRQYIAVGPSSGIVTIYKVLTGDSIKSYDNSGVLTSLDINPDGTLLATNVHVYNFQTDSVVATLDGGMVKFSSDGNYLITTAGNIYDTKTWNVSGTFTTHATYPNPNGEMVASIDISSDNQYIAISSYMYKESVDTSHIIRLYQLSNLKVISEYVLEKGLGGFPNVCFSPDGKYLAGVAIDDTVRIWQLSDRTIYKKFGHYGGINAVAFSPDGNYLVEGGGYFKDLTLKIWNINSDSMIYTYPVYTIFKGGGALSISVNKDKTLIGVGGGVGIYMFNAKWNPVSVTENIITITNDTIYPNPTNSTANIEFTLLKAEQTTINIYDNNSNLITNLFNGLLISGTQNFQWDVNNVSNGMYYCNINVNNNFSTIKIIVNK